MTPEELDDRFEHHPPKDEDTAKAHERIRRSLRTVAIAIDVLVPEGREKSLALAKIEEAMFWANAGIARHVTPPGSSTTSGWIKDDDYAEHHNRRQG